jgi:hypothetical protein
MNHPEGTVGVRSDAAFRWSLDRVAELFVQPEIFFRSLLRGPHAGFFPFVIIWICGMGQVLDRLDIRMMMPSTTDRAVGLASGGWPTLLGMVVGGGVISGIFTWLIGGWWYRMRLRLSGSTDPAPRVARQVFIHARLIWTAPYVLLTVSLMPFYPNYATMSASAPFAMSTIVLPFWSVLISYRAVVSTFDVNRGRARVWFLILPMSILGTAMIVAFAIGLANAW